MLFDTWADESMQSGVQECPCIKFSSAHTGSCHLLPNWNNPQLPHCTQSSLKVPPHPAQVADEDAEVDGMGRLSFLLALLFTSDLLIFSVLLPTLSIAALPFLSFSLLSHFIYF